MDANIRDGLTHLAAALDDLLRDLRDIRAIYSNLRTEFLHMGGKLQELRHARDAGEVDRSVANAILEGVDVDTAENLDERVEDSLDTAVETLRRIISDGRMLKVVLARADVS
jgi:hypothetical protein